MDRSEKALSLFDNKYNCSQSVLTAFSEDLDMTEDELLRVACAFGGGIGRQQLTCGALTGASMVLGLKFGKGLNDSEDKKQETYSRVVGLFEEFARLNGTSNCRELLHNLDMNDENDYKTILEKNLFHTNCRKYVADAVKITGQIIETSKKQ